MDKPTSKKKSRPTVTQITVQLTRKGPLHIILIVVALIWIVPNLGLGITSFRTRGDISQSGWWTTIAGNRSSTEKPMEIKIIKENMGVNISVNKATSALLVDTKRGFPSANIGQFNVLELHGELAIEDTSKTVSLPNIGILTFANETVNFIPDKQFDDYFIIDKAEFSGLKASLSYRLTGLDIMEGTIEIKGINESVRIPRTGTLTLLEGGMYSFEPRSSFVGTFEAIITKEAMDRRPISVKYIIVQTGGTLLSSKAGDTLDIPLAGSMVVNPDGSYSFSPVPNFTGTIVAEASVLNPIFTIDNYRGVLNRKDLPPPGFLASMKNSMVITIPSTILPIIIGAFAAYAFAWLKFPFRDSIYLLIIALLVVPMQTTWVPVLKILNTIGINGTFLGIWITHTGYGLPFAIFLLYNFFRELPGDIFEAARIDGANEVFVFFRIVLPLSVPAIASLAIFQFVWVWNDLMNALIFLGPDKAPLTIGVRNLLGQYATEWDLLAAGAFVIMIIPLIVFLAFQKFFVRGLTAGAVKG